MKGTRQIDHGPGDRGDGQATTSGHVPIGERGDMNADTWPPGPAAGATRRAGHRHGFACSAVEEVKAVDQCGTVMARHRTLGYRQDGGGQDGVLACPAA